MTTHTPDPLSPLARQALRQHTSWLATAVRGVADQLDRGLLLPSEGRLLLAECLDNSRNSELSDPAAEWLR